MKLSMYISNHMRSNVLWTKRFAVFVVLEPSVNTLMCEYFEQKCCITLKDGR